MLHSEVRCYAFNVSIPLNTLISDVLSFANCKYKLRWNVEIVQVLPIHSFSFFFRLIRRDKVRPPTEPHYNNSTQLRKKEHHKHVKMFLLGRNESVGMYPQIHPSPFVFKSSKNHVFSISWFSIAGSTKPNGCNLYSVLNLLCCWISQCEKKNVTWLYWTY